MDYGQVKPLNDANNQSFFTTGENGDFEHENQPEAEKKDNLNLENGFAEQNNTINSYRAIGNRTMNFPESTSANRVSDFASAAPELGRIINLEMPSGFDESLESTMNLGSVDDVDSRNMPMDFNVIRDRKDSISPETLKMTEHVVEKFEKGKINPAELDDFRWEATKAYLKNSYGRELGI